jgi:hypothetical protein
MCWRLESLSPKEFLRYWLEAHGPLARIHRDPARCLRTLTGAKQFCTMVAFLRSS